MKEQFITDLLVPQTIELQTFPAVPEAIRNVRQWTTERLETYKPDEEAIGTAEIIISELATNVPRHCDPRPKELVVGFGLMINRGVYTVLFVGDNVKTDPKLIHSPANAESGRGLDIIDSLTEGKWGVTHDIPPLVKNIIHDTQKLVWSRIPITIPKQRRVSDISGPYPTLPR